jgi:predicted cupin superfamily sugar epimerase
MSAARPPLPAHPRAAALVQQLGLQPHPEGGWYAEVFRSALQVTAAPGPAHPPTATSPPLRAALTSIYFLLPEGTVSRWHVVQSDELWCHLEGAPLALYQFDADSERVTEQQLGPVDATLRPQATVPATIWQAARSLGGYSLAACMVAPGFEFADFRLMSRQDEAHARLQRVAPAWADWV